MAVQLDEGHAIFLGPGEGEQLSGRQRELRVKYEGGELEVLEFWCEPGFGPIEPHVHETTSTRSTSSRVRSSSRSATRSKRAGPGTWVAAPPEFATASRFPAPKAHTS